MFRHSYRNAVYVRTALLVAGTWVAALAAFHWIGVSRMTADKAVAFAAGVRWAGQSAATRAAFVRELADRVNRLPFAGRQTFWGAPGKNGVLRGLTQEELRAFVDRVRPPQIDRALDAFNRLPPAERQSLLERLLGAGGSLPPGSSRSGEAALFANPVVARRIAEEGLPRALLQGDPAVALFLMPFLECVQHSMEER